MAARRSCLYDETLRLWDVATGETLRIFMGHTHWVSSCAFSPDGRQVLSTSYDETLRLWDLTTGETLAIWHTDAGLRCCAFHPDGVRVLAGDARGGVHFLTIGGETTTLPATAHQASTAEAHRSQHQRSVPVTDASLEASPSVIPQEAPAGKPRRHAPWWHFWRR